MQTDLQINGRAYTMPDRPAVVICLDGCEPAYIDQALSAGVMPALAGMLANGGARHLARSAMPSFTNPNNLSIACGVPSSVHGICGNFFLNPETGEAVMMNGVEFLRAPTVFAGFQQAGAKVAVVTAKDKLRARLGAGLDCSDGQAICFSAERADQAALDTRDRRAGGGCHALEHEARRAIAGVGHLLFEVGGGHAADQRIRVKHAATLPSRQRTTPNTD